MKTDPIPATCLLALTLMSGAVLSHWSGIDDRVQLARLRAGQPTTTPAQSAAPAPAAELAATVQAPAPQQLVARTAPAALDERFVRALEGFEQLQRENRNLRDQVAETNRDLMQLQFRVDTHSESFRPLRSTQESGIPSGPGVLPPLESP